MAAKLSDTVSVYDDCEKWKKELEKAGFSHIDGLRPICYDCGLRPVLDHGDSPSQIHAELCGHCKFAKENIFARAEKENVEAAPDTSDTGSCSPESEGIALNAQGGEILQNAERAEAPPDTEIGKTPATKETPIHVFTKRNELTRTKGNVPKIKHKDHCKMDEIGMGTAPTPQYANSQQKPDDKRPVATVEERMKEMTIKTQCKSCFKSLRNSSLYIFMPCGHGHCSDCAFDQVECKMCKARVEQKIETFWS